MGCDGWNGVLVALFVDGDESSVGVFVGFKKRKAEEAPDSVGIGADVLIGDGCGSRIFVLWVVASGEDSM